MEVTTNQVNNNNDNAVETELHDIIENDLYITNPEQWLQNLTERYEYVCIVLFRGHWCKFDEHYLKLLGQYQVDHMQPEGEVKLIAWTSEGPDGARQADEAWNLRSKYGYAAVLGDNTCALGKYMQETELLPKLVISSAEEAHLPKDRVSKDAYPNGLVQPGMMFYAHHGVEVLHWEAKVSRPFYGATTRPVPSEVWRKVKKRKKSLDEGNAIMPVKGTKLAQCTSALEVYTNHMPAISKILHKTAVV
mmetsp:Transcript_15112/g.23460  ORF Transcript_15112/g.23460 Transcript_15112/m.23460 type:complete len:248 (+) Transcript_15112:56-799(+)|eukprot:CAMPEP_0196814960 /NCGR_PEP_ID=MMETSP1362-20130617/47061_1 /TAXON_ID=163516 /ORGANISM="Leptocylindrus danicus, Strain CCMP1856" /LENGTH=247 /DNA_ID=CAMNT_0042191769 /DNA_START=29 /DNA_END=772 /DNA_ORIENTATION=+